MRFLLKMLFEFYVSSKPKNNIGRIKFVIKYLVLPGLAVWAFVAITSDRPLVDIRQWFVNAWQNLIAIMTIVCSFLFATAPILVSMKEVDESKIKSLAKKKESEVEDIVKKIQEIRDFLLMQSVFCLIQAIITCSLIIISWLIENSLIYQVTIFSLTVSLIIILSLIGSFSFYWNFTSVKKLSIRNESGN